MTKLFMAATLSCAMAFVASTAQAEIDGHGPDAWRVTGVAADDVLNMRMGPGTDYLVIDSLPHNARALKQVTCVPLMIPSIYNRLSEEQRENLPQRWCLMQTDDYIKSGWVAQRFLEPDWGHVEADDVGSDVVHKTGDAMIDYAAQLVSDLYASFEAQSSAAEYPFGPRLAPQYFFAGVVSELAGRGGDVLYNAQDFQGEITRIAPDPDQPMLQGMITINVDFTNFGQPSHAVFFLRADPDQSGAPIRIFRVEHEGWSFPQ